MSQDSEQEDVPDGVNVDDHQSFPHTRVWYISNQQTGDKRLAPLTCPACLVVIRDEDLLQHDLLYQEIMHDPECEITKTYRDYRLCPFCSKAKLYIGCRWIVPLPPSVVSDLNILGQSL